MCVEGGQRGQEGAPGASALIRCRPLVVHAKCRWYDLPLVTEDVNALICDLARSFYALGWSSGAGGGICTRDGDRVVMAPSAVQKERMQPDQMFTIALDGAILSRPAD